MAIEIAPHADFSGAWRPLVDELKNVPGDVAEFGVYNGGSSRILSVLFPDRTIWAFDTYEGMPKEDFDSQLDRDGPGSFRPAYTVAEMFGSYLNVIPVKGRFSETIEHLPLRPKFAFVYIDCDLYKSARDIFSWLPWHLMRGAVIFLDDYGTHRGIQAAVHEFMQDNAQSLGLVFDGKHVIRVGIRP